MVLTGVVDEMTVVSVLVVTGTIVVACWLVVCIAAVVDGCKLVVEIGIKVEVDRIMVVDSNSNIQSLVNALDIMVGV